MRNTFTIRYECKKAKANKQGLSPVAATITVCGQSSIIQLPFKCRPEDFKTLLKSKAMNDVRQYTDTVTDKINQVYMYLQANNEPLTAARIKGLFKNGITKSSYTLKELWNDFRNLKSAENIEPHTWNKYNNVYEDFKALTGHKDTDEVKSIKNADILLYEAKIRQKWSDTTCCKALKNLKAFFALAVASGKISSNPFERKKIGHGTSDKTTDYLTLDEIKKVRNVRITCDRLEQVRDVFLWQCFTGQNYSDMTILQAGDVKRNKEGQYYIKKARYKTGKFGKEHIYTAVLFEDAITIYETYGENLPLISPQKYNKYLSEIIKAAEIEKNITSKSGRKTYACYLFNYLHLDPTIIQPMLGHENLKQTQEYIEVFKETIFENVKKNEPTKTQKFKEDIMDILNS